MEVTSIQNGIIIDHVPAGTSLKVLEYLKIDPAKTKLALIMNADSKRYGSKDIIKIEDDKDIDLDVLYMTRVQKERFFNEDDYLRLRDTYILDEEKLQLAKPSMAVLHPLPRVNEIAVDVDDDPRAAYFEQVKNGMLVRMALESTVVGDELPGYEPLNPKEVQA